MKYGYLHSKIEHGLLDSIDYLKDSNSNVWISLNDSDPEVGNFTAILLKMKEITNLLKNEKAKADLINAYEIWEEGMNNHNISKLFEAHEIIHDYDYWVINTPLELPFAPADWSGTKIYFRQGFYYAYLRNINKKKYRFRYFF